MTWQFERRKHIEFRRNPLVSVVGQLNFHPILKLEPRLFDLHEQLRGEYPGYAEGTHREVGFTSDGEVRVNTQPQHVLRDREGEWRIILRRDSLSVESGNHASHKDFRDRFKSVLAAFENAGSVERTRFGLRYVNLIDRAEIAATLDDETLTWSQLVQDDFFGLPAKLVDLEDTRFFSEVNSAREPGRLVVRYGLTGEDNERLAFRIDFDRFVSDDDLLDDCSGLIERFSHDIFSLFRAAAGDSLVRWMEQELQPGDD